VNTMPNMENFQRHLEGYRQAGTESAKGMIPELRHVSYIEGGMEYLRENIKELQRFESLDELKGMKLSRVRDFGHMLIPEYEIQKDIPDLRAGLINGTGAVAGLVGSYKRYTGEHEIHTVRLPFYTSGFQIILNVEKSI